MLDRRHLPIAVNPHRAETIMASRVVAKLLCGSDIARRPAPSGRCARRRSSRSLPRRAAVAAARLTPR